MKKIFLNCDSFSLRFFLLEKIIDIFPDSVILVETPDEGWKEFFEVFFDQYFAVVDMDAKERADVEIRREIIFKYYQNNIIIYHGEKISGIIVRKGDPCCGALLWVVAAIINIKNFGDDKYVMLPMRSCCNLFDWFLKIGDVLAIDGYDSREDKSDVMFIDDSLIFYEKLISEMSKVWDFFLVMPFWNGSAVFFSAKNDNVVDGVKNEFYGRVIDYEKDFALKNPFDGPVM